MDDPVDRLLREAPGLSRDRARIVTELLTMLEPTAPNLPRSESEWIREIERRARAAVAGSPGLSWSEARAWIRARFSSR